MPDAKGCLIEVYDILRQPGCPKVPFEHRTYQIFDFLSIIVLTFKFIYKSYLVTREVMDYLKAYIIWVQGGRDMLCRLSFQKIPYGRYVCR